MTDIIFEDEDILILYKPGGVAAQTANFLEEDVVSFVRNYRIGKKEAGYVALINRLDKPVEGLILIAKNKNAAAFLSNELKERKIRKFYYAVVHYNHEVGFYDNIANICSDEAEQNIEKIKEINGKKLGKNVKIYNFIDYIIKDKNNKRAKIVDKDKYKNAKRASLKAFIEEEKEGVSLLNIELLTGRFHQIRCQLAYHDMPILGDRKYGISKEAFENLKGKEAKKENEPLGDKELSLCAYKLIFIHPKTNKKMTFSITPKGKKFLEFNAIKDKDLKE